MTQAQAQAAQFAEDVPFNEQGPASAPKPNKRETANKSLGEDLANCAKAGAKVAAYMAVPVLLVTLAYVIVKKA